MIKIPFFAVLLLLCVSCAKTNVTIEDELQAAKNVTNARVNFNKLSGKWTFTEYLKDKTVPADGEASIEFAASETTDKLQVNGRAFVNFYNTHFTFNEAKSSIEFVAPVSTTKMAGTPEMMKAEFNFLNNLKNVTKFSVDGTSLKLYVGEPVSEIIYFKK